MVALLIISALFLIVGLFLLLFNLDTIIEGYSKMTEQERFKKGYTGIKKIRHYGIIFIIISIFMVIAYFLN